MKPPFLSPHFAYTDSEADGLPIGWYCLTCSAGDGSFHESEEAARAVADAHERRFRVRNTLWRVRSALRRPEMI